MSAAHLLRARLQTTRVGGACAVPLLSQARDLGRVKCLPRDSVPQLSVFNFRDAIPERVQTARTTPSAWETKGQARGLDEFSAPTAPAQHRPPVVPPRTAWHRAARC